MSIQSVGRHCIAATSGMPVVGRTPERARLEQLLGAAQSGQSAALVLRGAPGIGKTALLEYAARQATGFRIITTRGVEAEKDLSYAALQLLCAQVDDCLGRVPSAQREALATVIGLRPGPEPDRFLTALGLRAALSAVADAQPLLCIIDDAQWLDHASAQVLASAARRLNTESVVLLIAERQPGEPSQFSDLPDLALEGLPDAGTRQLFGALIPGRVDESALARVVAETRGNPRALHEFLDGVSPAQFAGGLGQPAATPQDIDEDLPARIGRLPDDSRRLLVLAAAEPVGDPALMWRAAARLGISMDAVDPLEAAGLLSLDSRVLFTRPRARAVVYGMASKNERRHVHEALAEVTSQERDRRAWHRAVAAAGPDDQIAQELDACAATVRRRAGLAAAAAFLERAAMLTLDAGLRVDRALRAAAAKLEAGDPAAAAKLVVIADLGGADPTRRCRAQRTRAQIAGAARRDDAAELLATAAQHLEVAEPAIARETYLEALTAAVRTGCLGSTGADEVASVARMGPPAAHPPRPVDLLLDAVTIRLTKNYEDAVEPIHAALDALRSLPRSEEPVPWLGLGCRLASDVWDDETWQAMTVAQLDQARDADALAVLPHALTDRAMFELSCGDLAAAAGLIAEADAVTARTGCPRLSDASLVLAAWRGHDDAPALFAQARDDARQQGEGTVLTTASYSAAVFANARRCYDEALTAATEAADFDEPGLGGWALVELVEAAARRGRRDAAASALERLSDRTSRIGSNWARGTEARCRALLSDDRTAEDLYREAIERLKPTRMKTELARAELVYGEWLRRQGRRLDARTLLRASRNTFTATGVDAFAERAHLELLATGETARRRSVDTQMHLTPQEARVAVLARDGLTNPEIGERLFVSPKTVEYHLTKVFAKLGITSRKELHLALANGDGEPLLAFLPSPQDQSGGLKESQCA